MVLVAMAVVVAVAVAAVAVGSTVGGATAVGPRARRPAVGSGGRRVAIGVGGVLIAAGGTLAGVGWFGTQGPLRTPESALAAVTLGALVAAPGVLVLVGAATGRPGMALPAAMILVPLSFLSFALVLLPLLIPAVVLFRYVARATPEVRWARAVGAGVVGVAVLLVAVGTFVVGRTSRSYTDADGMGGGSTTGWVPWPTSLLTLALLGAAVLVSFTVAGPPPAVGPPSSDRDERSPAAYP